MELEELVQEEEHALGLAPLEAELLLLLGAAQDVGVDVLDVGGPRPSPTSDAQRVPEPGAGLLHPRRHCGVAALPDVPGVGPDQRPENPAAMYVLGGRLSTSSGELLR